MFNKHGRQTPIKSGSNLLGRGGARGLPTMLPMLGGRPYGAEFNPLWARKPAGHGLDQARIENELRNRFPALPNIPNLEQLQLLQDQAALMANISKNNELLGGNGGDRPEMMMPGNGMMQNPNSVLIAQIAAQMQRACQHQINNPDINRIEPGTSIEEIKDDIVNIKSEENSRATSPKHVTGDGQISVLSDGDVIPGGLENQSTPLNASSPSADVPDDADKKSEKSTKEKDENGEPVVSSPSSMENTREEETKDPNESIEIIQAKNDEENMENNTDIVVEPTSPIPSFGGSVKSDKLNEDLLANPRKRKMDEPLDYSINEQLFQHRLQQNRQLFPFPMANFPVC